MGNHGAFVVAMTLLVTLVSFGCEADEPIQAEALSSVAAAPATGRLLPLTFRGPDGLDLPTGAFADTARGGERCSFQTAADGRFRCLPSTIEIWPLAFADAACLEPASLAPTACAVELSDYVAVRATWQCYAGVRIFERGAELTGTYVRAHDGECIPAGLHLGARAFALGAEIAPEAFAEGSLNP